MNFTDQQIKDWKAFERVSSGGKYNMLDPRAMQSTGLDKGRFKFVMENFSELKKAAAKLILSEQTQGGVKSPTN